MSRYRLELYDDYSTAELESAIDAWIHNAQHRQILKYKLIDGYSYLQTADLMTQELGYYVSIDTVKRAVYKAEGQLFKHLRIIRR